MRRLSRAVRTGETWKLLAVLAATALVVGCGTRGDSADRPAGQNPDAVPTVGSVTSPDGVEIRYEVAGRGEPVLVFVHGWSCDRSYWRAQLDHFAMAHRVVAVDLGGHGESGLGRESWTMAAFGDDVRAVVEELELQKVILVGHSMGTYVIFEAARLMPDRVMALVPVDQIFDPDTRFGGEERDRFIAGLRADFSGTTQAFVRQFLFKEGADSTLAGGIARDMGAAPPTVAVSAMENLLAYDEGAALAAMKVPVRLINADLWPTNLENVRRHNPTVELTILPDVATSS